MIIVRIFLDSAECDSAARPNKASSKQDLWKTGGGEGQFREGKKARLKLRNSARGAQVGNQTAAYCPVASSSLG